MKTNQNSVKDSSCHNSKSDILSYHFLSLSSVVGICVKDVTRHIKSECMFSIIVCDVTSCRFDGVGEHSPSMQIYSVSDDDILKSMQLSY